MLDTEIHNGLADEEMRNAISVIINESFTSKPKEDRPRYPFNGTAVEKTVYRINDLKMDIQEKEEDIKTQERLLAMQTLMQYKGWQEFDVSDYVALNDNARLYRNFIGTEEEYKALIKKIEQDEDIS